MKQKVNGIIKDVTMKEKLLEIQQIENKYGLALFRMGLYHLADVGRNHLTTENVEAAMQQIIAEGKENEANGVITVMTPQFQCSILRCAAELAKFSITELFLYIKKYVVIAD